MKETVDTVRFNLKRTDRMKRVISGAVFVAIIAGFLLLRQFVDYRLFTLLIFVFSVGSAIEMAKATKSVVGKNVSICTIIFGTLLVPVYCLFNYWLKDGYGWLFGVIIILLCLVCNFFILFNQDKTRGASFFAFLDAVYPSICILLMLMVNDIEVYNGFLATLTLFVVSPCSDTMAFSIGSLFGGPKLCPRLSPKKTWSGAIGGVCGGAIGALLVYLVFARSLGGSFTWFLFALMGFVGSVFTQLGDLFESYIKRKLNIKDMGNIMPGHGGILDRVDGACFASAVVLVAFMLL